MNYTRNTIAKMLKYTGQHIKYIIKKYNIQPKEQINMPNSVYNLYDIEEIKKHLEER
jgi:hypothetical protein